MLKKNKFKYVWFLFQPYWKYGKKYMLVTIAMAVLLMPAAQVLGTMLPQYAIDAVIDQKPRFEILGIIAIFTAVIALVSIIQNVLSQAYAQLQERKILYRILHVVNEKALKTDFKYYDNPEYFTAFSFTQQNFHSSAMIVARLIPQVLQAIVTAIAMGTIIVSAGPVLLGVSLFFIAIQTILSLPQAKLNTDFAVLTTELSRPVDYVFRVIQQKENAAEMRASRAGKKLLLSFKKTIDGYVLEYQRFIRKLLKFSIPQGMIYPFQTSVILAYIVIFVIDGDVTKIGLYASLTLATGTLAGSVSSFFNNITTLFQQSMYGEQIYKFFDSESIIETGKTEGAAIPRGKYEVEFKDVAFHYSNTSSLFENLNLTISKGQRIAIVGENGAGKSTLAKMLVRLYDVASGSICINGADIREYDIHELRRHIGIAFQDVRVLAMSLRDNLTAYHDATDEELEKVLIKCGLEDVMRRVNNNFDTLVSREFTEDGIALSGGEAQKLSLARLFVGEFGLLLLDEPTSSLDPLAESRLMEVITDASNTATTIMVAHRLSTVRDFDVIYHMDKGKIIESGTHDELMEAQGKYFEMFERQASNYQSDMSAGKIGVNAISFKELPGLTLSISNLMPRYNFAPFLFNDEQMVYSLFVGDGGSVSFSDSIALTFTDFETLEQSTKVLEAEREYSIYEVSGGVLYLTSNLDTFVSFMLVSDPNYSVFYETAAMDIGEILAR